MPVNTEELLRAVSMLADDHNMRVTVKQSAKGAIICGTMCFIGGVIGGPGNSNFFLALLSNTRVKLCNKLKCRF